MIKCDFGEVRIEGSTSLIKAELSTIVFALKTKKILSDDDIQEAVKDALETSQEEVNKAFGAKLDKLLTELKKIIEERED